MCRYWTLLSAVISLGKQYGRARFAPGGVHRQRFVEDRACLTRFSVVRFKITEGGPELAQRRCIRHTSASSTAALGAVDRHSRARYPPAVLEQHLVLRIHQIASIVAYVLYITDGKDWDDVGNALLRCYAGTLSDAVRRSRAWGFSRPGRVAGMKELEDEPGPSRGAELGGGENFCPSPLSNYRRPPQSETPAIPFGVLALFSVPLPADFASVIREVHAAYSDAEPRLGNGPRNPEYMIGLNVVFAGGRWARKREDLSWSQLRERMCFTAMPLE
ncbi:hypothetical protein C8F01DRAFT_1080470 [Mycena amicta]|nr:hypothetical protein C8F01DRAFT_1080470 [Mycena amicta]